MVSRLDGKTATLPILQAGLGGPGPRQGPVSGLEASVITSATVSCGRLLEPISYAARAKGRINVCWAIRPAVAKVNVGLTVSSVVPI